MIIRLKQANFLLEKLPVRRVVNSTNKMIEPDNWNNKERKQEKLIDVAAFFLFLFLFSLLNSYAVVYYILLGI